MFLKFYNLSSLLLSFSTVNPGNPGRRGLVPVRLDRFGQPSRSDALLPDPGLDLGKDRVGPNHRHRDVGGLHRRKRLVRDAVGLSGRRHQILAHAHVEICRWGIFGYQLVIFGTMTFCLSDIFSTA